MRPKTALKIRDRYVSRVHSFFISAENQGQSHEELLAKINHWIYMDKDWKRVTGYVREYLSGVIDTLFRQTWHEKTKGKWCIKDNTSMLLDHHEIGGDNQTKWSEVEYVGQFWKDNGKPYTLKQG